MNELSQNIENIALKNTEKTQTGFAPINFLLFLFS
jgi:hypothetical protein